MNNALYASLRSNLAAIDPTDMIFHASRYTSAQKLQNLVFDMLNDMTLTPEFIVTEVREIAFECENDGSVYGNIPCLGGESNEKWQEALQLAEMIEV